MRNYQTKANQGAVSDSIVAEKFGAGEFNSVAQELENACTRAGLTLAAADGTAEIFLQLAEAMFLNGFAATSVVAAGTVDAITTTPTSGATGFVIPANYTNFDGAVISFIPTGANTTAVTLSIGQTGGSQLGTKKVFDSAGAALTGGEIGTARIELRFDAAADAAVGAWLIQPWAEAMAAASVFQRNFLGGLNLSNDTDTDHDINILSGEATDSTGAGALVLSSEITKRIDATWAVGDDAGGLFSGTVANDTTYFMFLIEKDSDGSIDAGFDISITAANIPAGYTKFRRIGVVLTNGSANILNGIWSPNGDRFTLNTPILDVDTTVGTTHVDYVMSMPSGLKVLGHFNAFSTKSLTDNGIFLSDPDLGITAAASITVSPLSTAFGNGNGAGTGSATAQADVVTDTSSQIRGVGFVASNVIRIATLGWTDTRGK